jgi:uncharacterized protein with HEPN domain
LPFREPSLSLRDISEAINLVDDFVSGMDFDAFRQDPKTIAAVERKLLVISEAATRLGEQAATLCPDQPWHKIRATGNWLRHGYDRISLETVWGTVKDDLPSLKAAVLRALALPAANPKDPTPG